MRLRTDWVLTGNNAADVIRRLERRGFLDRPSSTKDKRAKLARITEEGLKIAQDAFPLMIKAQERLSDPLDEEEYTLLMDLMESSLWQTTPKAELVGG